MSNSVATSNNLPTSPDDITKALANMQNATRGAGPDGDGSFMKFSKGEFLFGSDGIEPEEGSKWAINPASFRHGNQCWGKSKTPSDGSLLGEETASMMEAPIVKTNLPVFDEGRWADLIGFQLTCVSGEDEGTQVYLSGTSVGFVKEGKKLINTLLAHMGEDASTPVAITLLETDNYKHKKYGKIYTPVFNIVGWESMDATAVSDKEAEPEQEEEKEVEKEAPKRRRRRTASE